MKLLPERRAPRFAALTGYLLLAAVLLILFFEFVVNRHLLPSNY